MTDIQLRHKVSAPGGLYPNGMRSPILGQTHVLHGNLWVFREEILHSLAPTACRCDQSQHVTANHQNNPAAVILQFILSMPCWEFVLLRKKRRIAKLAIPESAVVGAGVARSIESPQPRNKKLVGKDILCRQLAFDVGIDPLS